jgi:hypothetical protein
MTSQRDNQIRDNVDKLIDNLVKLDQRYANLRYEIDGVDQLMNLVVIFVHHILKNEGINTIVDLYGCGKCTGYNRDCDDCIAVRDDVINIESILEGPNGITELARCYEDLIDSQVDKGMFIEFFNEVKSRVFSDVLRKRMTRSITPTLTPSGFGSNWRASPQPPPSVRSQSPFESQPGSRSQTPSNQSQSGSRPPTPAPSYQQQSRPPTPSRSQSPFVETRPTTPSRWGMGDDRISPPVELPHASLQSHPQTRSSSPPPIVRVRVVYRDENNELARMINPSTSPRTYSNQPVYHDTL